MKTWDRGLKQISVPKLLNFEWNELPSAMAMSDTCGIEALHCVDRRHHTHIGSRAMWIEGMTVGGIEGNMGLWIQVHPKLQNFERNEISFSHGTGGQYGKYGIEGS